MKIFLAGATGAVGKRLVPLLVRGGHQVVATTRRADKVEGLRAAGAEAVVIRRQTSGIRHQARRSGWHA
jgi:uncharacterized protein YbjT (DUF2867 family)